MPTGQIVYDLNRREVAAASSTTILDRQGVFRVGRYSEWKYLMSDACVLGGRRAARRLREQNDDTNWDGVAITDDDVPDEVAEATGERARRSAR